MSTAIVLSEQNIISCIVKNPDLIWKVQEDFFVSSTAKNLFKALQYLIDNKVILDLKSLYTEFLKLDNSLEESKLKILLETPVEIGNFNYFVESLKVEKCKKDINTEIIDNLLKETSKKDFNIKKIEDFSVFISKNLETLKEDYCNKSMDIPQALNAYERSIKERFYNNRYYSTGDYHLDCALTTAFEPGYFNILCARSGVGKSSFALKLLNNQMNRMIPCLRVSNEMTFESDMDRLIAMRHKIPLPMFYPKSGMEKIPEYILRCIDSERVKLAKNKYFRYIYAPGFDLHELEKEIKITKKQMGVDYLSVQIDLLSKLDDFSGDNKASKAEDGVNLLDTIMKRQKCSALGIIQLKRNDKKTVNVVEDLETFRPSVEDIKNAGAFEERARIVMTMFRSKFHAIKCWGNEDPKLDTLEDIAEIEIVKQNLGTIGTRLKYLFDGETCSFYHYKEEEI